MAGSLGDIAGEPSESRNTSDMGDAAWTGAIRAELVGNILPFWMTRAVDRDGDGFHGLIDVNGSPDPNAPRSCVLNARILWTFSAALRVLGESYRPAAERAFAYFGNAFWDREYGGLFWMLDQRSRPLEQRKQIYGHSFGIYGLAEYYRATGVAAALEQAKALFLLMEEHGRDRNDGGYWEAFGRDWHPLEDMRLSDKDLNCPKSMNTNLHVMEAYTNLLRASGDGAVRESLADLLTVVMNRIVDDDAGHLKLFFDAHWNALSGVVSYGHDIEASWLLVETAEVLGDKALIARSRELAIGLASSVYRYGLGPDGGVSYEAGVNHVIRDANRHWWVQAEAMVGFYNAWQISGEELFLNASRRVWRFIETRLADRRHGEWHAKISPAGLPVTVEEDPDINLAGPWKCPYHNARACLEMLRRNPTE